MIQPDRVLVVATTIARANAVIKTLNLANAIATSTRAISSGSACRGITADIALIDDEAWPLDEPVRETIEATLLAGSGHTYHFVERVSGEARP
ncbi:hypothetical protein [Mycolicibacterium fortuitum]|uniref:hypothetical protein n=1 Tax=Mycolicibacterium fortuitum TaxID=1766 RepID=UPI001CE0CFC8|nr:hypothetical protein [Mycolicibacterium fortuitum]MCA4754809.1 hypothetical protein [Mycolicibacterium fortuitum]MDG5773942.1 hypothetical protein [Mycolicibacterium fortuitum]MDG5779672.1 hypothetical protein [Mycolicibacterium fortuitum]